MTPMGEDGGDKGIGRTGRSETGSGLFTGVRTEEVLGVWGT